MAGAQTESIEYREQMGVLRMMLRLFTTIFGTTHPCKEDEDKYAWMLFAIVVAIIGGMICAAWLAVKIM